MHKEVKEELRIRRIWVNLEYALLSGNVAESSIYLYCIYNYIYRR